MSMPTKFLRNCLPLLGLLALTPAMAEPEGEPPAELKRLVPNGSKLLDWQVADLNVDGRPDVLAVYESAVEQSDDDGPRTLLIAIRQADGALKVVKRNDKVVYCRQCGGIFGDPFESLSAAPGKLSVHHYGGSNWRWSNTFSFAYSRRDETWQLVRVEESSFHTSAPDKMKTRAFKPPRDFGKIDIADFDPENFKGVGPK
jgi:hypothetical protein